MREISFDFGRTKGKIKPMHGIGQPPLDDLDDDLFHYLGEAGIPFSRLHDVGGNFGGNMFVDIHNIFRDFDKDPYDEASYDFAFTDILLKALEKQNCRPIYRLGETIENYHFIKAYRIFPPKDPKKWAIICEHIIRHYNYGWANGFHMGIEYWEIWNEPDNGRDDAENQMWHGTPEQFYELYSVAASHLKAVFGDEIKIGGYATCGFRHILSDPERFGIDCERSDDTCYSSERSANFLRFFEGFFAYIKKSGAPLDFFSWHSYLSTEHTAIVAGYVERRLAELGYAGIETQMNEWNNSCQDRGNPLEMSEHMIREWGTGLAAAKAAAMMCAMQKTSTKILCYYDARLDVSYYGGMFNPLTRKPFPLYYSFLAFNALYQLGGEVASSKDGDGIYSLGAEKGDRRAALIVNESESDTLISTNLDPSMRAYIIDDTRELAEIAFDPKSIALPAGSAILFKN